jgi:uncharacterized protein YdaU (DUF1376 family)
VKYYSRHIGDYIGDTAHLSLLEHGVYTRLLDVYYMREEPIPADQAHRLVGARTPEEREAVDSILREFFRLEGDGWRNKRCDDELARYQSKQDKARQSASARWAHSDGNADAMRTHSERIATAPKSDANAMRTQCEGNAIQEPITNNQERERTRKRASRLPDGWKPEPEPSLTLPDDFDPDGEYAKFRDYWTGNGQTKADWQATWRNWVRRCLESGRYAKRGGGIRWQ